MRIRWWIGDQRVSGREFAVGVVWLAYDAFLNWMALYWLCQLALPSLGIHPPTLLGALGIAGLLLIIRHPIRVSDWLRDR